MVESEYDVIVRTFKEQGFILDDSKLNLIHRFPCTDRIFKELSIIVYQDTDGNKYLIKWRFDPRNINYAKLDYTILGKKDKYKLQQLLGSSDSKSEMETVWKLFNGKYVIVTDEFLNKR